MVSGILGAILLLYMWVSYQNVARSTATLASENANRLATDLSRTTALGISPRMETGP